ncbi:hypothetical protein QBC46DRAFT_409247 [Diplogelasinospora grovesii]|uniref:Uncharacterized protein n=1 Tax=Diplogelasinospora grovesii TaxID=303347 RepID=A0AAN6S3P2_9PEZI|nr:hypothetical protein QBC46DRAFT_409247 [Diplogelasinospora grovesii]
MASFLPFLSECLTEICDIMPCDEAAFEREFAKVKERSQNRDPEDTIATALRAWWPAWIEAFYKSELRALLGTLQTCLPKYLGKVNNHLITARAAYLLVFKEEDGLSQLTDESLSVVCLTDDDRAERTYKVLGSLLSALTIVSQTTFELSNVKILVVKKALGNALIKTAEMFGIVSYAFDHLTHLRASQFSQEPQIGACLYVYLQESKIWLQLIRQVLNRMSDFYIGRLQESVRSTLLQSKIMSRTVSSFLWQDTMRSSIRDILHEYSILKHVSKGMLDVAANALQSPATSARDHLHAGFHSTQVSEEPLEAFSILKKQVALPEYAFLLVGIGYLDLACTEQGAVRVGPPEQHSYDTIQLHGLSSRDQMGVSWLCCVWSDEKFGNIDSGVGAFLDLPQQVGCDVITAEFQFDPKVARRWAEPPKVALWLHTIPYDPAVGVDIEIWAKNITRSSMSVCLCNRTKMPDRVQFAWVAYQPYHPFLISGTVGVPQLHGPHAGTDNELLYHMD